MAVGGVNQGSDFELLEPYPEDPVPRCTSEGPETVPTGHRSSEALRGHFRRRNVLVYVDRFVAMVAFHFT